jgi:hypothetical protein
VVTKPRVDSTHLLEIEGEVKEMFVWLGSAATFPSFRHEEGHLGEVERLVREVEGLVW